MKTFMYHSILITLSKPKTPVELLLPYGQMTGHRGTGSQDFADFVDPSRLPTQSEISFLPAAMNQQPNQVNHPKRLLLTMFSFPYSKNTVDSKYSGYQLKINKAPFT